ncbi:steroid 3-ketoacyl-CoA thiolase [Rhodosalinus halophilus]|uniref:Steroid 3-ketoacyl-CoA thiolase n=1 Tax=Rhodosalinus halophilus TaxID=2259333 RepID=A0A365UBH5_9RHOB|nr:thiolase family protein [Rhodosalinus halophilus]RBI86632.1 steroid 3-ketoacyl-CoA thiolase [Rhodosalinus halophilus]
MARRAVIVDVVRSPFGRGRASGALAALHPVDLYARVLQALVARTGVDPALVEDVITGCVIQVGEQAANIGRQAVLAAGFPETVPAVTLDRKCGSAQQAMDFAAQGVIAGAYDLVIAGGVEMMSRVEMKSNRMGRDNLGPMLHARYPEGLVHQGISAELIAAKWDLSREELDEYAFRSHQHAVSARGIVAPDIVALEVDGRTVDMDEGPRPDTSPERLADLSPAFHSDAMAARFPEIGWRVTAGNASQVTDGAGAMLIAEESVAARLGLTPRAAVSGFAVTGDDPVMMLTGVIPATRKLSARCGHPVEEIDVFEVNEAFASVVLAWQRELRVPLERVNIFGGAIALGHPVGASGIRLTGNLLRALEETDGRFGLQTMCESGGMANATLIERL